MMLWRLGHPREYVHRRPRFCGHRVHNGSNVKRESNSYIEGIEECVSWYISYLQHSACLECKRQHERGERLVGELELDRLTFHALYVGVSNSEDEAYNLMQAAR